MSPADVLPFEIAVADHVLTDLQARLDLARFPQNLELSAADEWSYGTPTHKIKDLVEYWKASLDWRKIEADINARLPQFTVPIDAEEPHGTLLLHFVHKRSSNPNAVPLLFSHGWPGNFLEVSKIIEPLTNPTDHKDPAFHVVAPSLPGYVFSETSKSPGLGLKITALMFDKLMKKLGYTNYIAQGGDWGALIVRALAVYHEGSCRATHTNMPLIPLPSIWRNPIRLSRVMLGFIGLPGRYSKREIEYLKQTKDFVENQSGYAVMQRTKPQTLAYGLTDSPTGLLAWMYEKLYMWTDAYPWTSEEILTWVMMYWISSAGTVGSLRYYREAGFAEGPPVNDEAAQIAGSWSNVPLGVSVFKGELYKFPDDWPGMVQPLKFHKVHDEGGHLAAYEKPDLLVDDIRRFTQIILKNDKKTPPKIMCCLHLPLVQLFVVNIKHVCICHILQEVLVRASCQQQKLRTAALSFGDS